MELPGKCCFGSFVAESIHVSDDHVNDVSRGRHCAFITLSALLCERLLCFVSRWTASTLDEILIKGDVMYFVTLFNKITELRLPDL